MIDPDEILLDFLQARAPIGDPEVVQVEAVRMFASPELPDDYVPEMGPSYLFAVAPGGVLDYSNAVIMLPYRFRTYGPSLEEIRAADLALVDVLTDAQTFRIRASRLTVPGQLLFEPETEWPYVLSTYEIMFINSPVAV